MVGEALMNVRIADGKRSCYFVILILVLTTSDVAIHDRVGVACSSLIPKANLHAAINFATAPNVI